ncbi:MAG: aminoacyl-tRNA hydrolase [Candidatus Aenigmarchaeota archaeon]|nr:aminoacyl-tRNA hydrolase [Candidatus Aenigmarchaeota archaeon]
MPFKQAIVIRKDLKLSKGKLAAQAAHACLEAYKKADTWMQRKWEETGSKKVVLKADSLSHMRDIHKKALAAGLPCALIKDAGRTEVPAGTVTALGIGPAEDEKLDKVTGKLKML